MALAHIAVPISFGECGAASARTALFAVASLLLCAVLSAQEPPKPAVISPNARLMAARSIFIEHAGGILPNDVIGDAFQGWGRYTVVADPARADLIVSINAPVTDSGVSVGGRRRGAAPVFPPPRSSRYDSSCSTLTIASSSGAAASNPSLR